MPTPKNLVRRPSFFLAALWLCLFLPTWARPAPPEQPVVTAGSEESATSEVSFRYPAGQVYQYDAIFPLVLEIANKSGSPKTYEASWPLQQPVPSTLKKLHLKPGEKRRFSLNFPRGDASNLYNITINNNPYAPDLLSNPRETVTGLLTPKSERFDYLRTLKLEVDPNVAQAATEDGKEPKTKLVPLATLSELDPELVPESWALLESLDVIIAYDLQSMTLSRDQQNALIAWAQRGGRLVLVSNGLPEEFRGTPFEEYLPLQPTSVASDQGMVTVTGQALPESKTLMNYRGRPLLLERQLMQGRLFFLTSPLTALSPLTGEEAEQLWRNIVPPGSTSGANNGYNQITNQTLRSIPELPRAKAGWVALFILLYAIIVGPVNLGVLRKRDKMLWSFVSVPAIAMLFAGAAYLINVSNRSSTPVFRELGYLEIQAQQTRGIARSEAVLFSPSSRRYALTSSPLAIVSATNQGYGEPPLSLYEVPPSGGLRTFLEMGTWDIFVAQTQSLIDLEKPIKGQFKGKTAILDSPLPSASNEALIYHPKLGISQAFTLQSGSQTVDLNLTPAPTYSMFSQISVSSDEHPGRQELADALSGRAESFRPDSAYLLFWTSEVRAPVETDPAATYRSDYLVIVELES